jgi:hypothetical protein
MKVDDCSNFFHIVGLFGGLQSSNVDIRFTSSCPFYQIVDIVCGRSKSDKCSIYG